MADDEHQVPPDPAPGDEPVPDEEPDPDDVPVPDHNPVVLPPEPKVRQD